MPSRKKLTKTSKRPRPSSRNPAHRGSASPGDWFEKLVAIQKRLREPGGCPWDREQTHQTLRTYLIEEAYEVLDALESGDDEKFVEELGDLLLQVTFHSQIASEEGRFSVSDVICAVHDKMIRRHPHVFGEAQAKDSAEVLKHWQRIKAQERLTKENSGLGEVASGAVAPKAGSALDGVPRSIPATLEGLQLTKKAGRTGFDWENATGIFAKVREETSELETTLETGTAIEAEEELGDLLFAVVNLARFLHIDPEIALKQAKAKFVRRFHEMERLAAASARKFEDMPRPEKESLWDLAKSSEPSRPEVSLTKHLGPAKQTFPKRKAVPHR
jgi:tetrapyrrole methylase family protein/MazG family protein